MKIRHKISLLFSLSIILLLGLGILILRATNIPEKQANDLLRTLISPESGLRVHIGKINREWWRRLELHEIYVDYTPPSGDSTRLAKIESIVADYSLTSFLSGRFILDSLLIDNPVVYLRRGADGKLFLPPKGDTAKEKNESQFLPGLIFGAKQVKVLDGRVELFTPENSLEGINIKGEIERIPPDLMEIIINEADLKYPLKDFVLTSLQSEVTLTPGKIEVFNLIAATGESDINGNIILRTGDTLQYSFNLAGDNFSFEELNRLAKVKLNGNLKYRVSGSGEGAIISGQAQLDGQFYDRLMEDVSTDFQFQDKRISFSNISGKIFKADISGAGWLDLSEKPEKYHANLLAKNLNLQNVIFNSLDTDFNGRVVLNGQGLTSANLLMNFDVNLGRTRIETYRFDRAAGKFAVTTKDINFADGFQAGYKHTDAAFGGRLEYKGDVKIKGDARFGDLDDFDGQIFLTDIGGRGEAIFATDGSILDFNLYGTFNSDSCHIYGIYTPSLEAVLALKSFVSHPEGEVKFGWTGGDIYSFPINSVNGFTLVAGDYTFIDSLKIKFEAGNVWLTGKYDGTLAPGELEIDSVILNVLGNKITNSGEIVLLLGEKDVGFPQFNLHTMGGEMQMVGAIDYENNMDLALKIKDLDISPYAALIDKENRWDGKLFVDAKVKGNFVSPIIESEVRVSDLGYNFYSLGNLMAKFNYDHKRLTASSVQLKDSLDNFEAAGYLPLDLSFEQVEDRLPDSAFFVDIKAKGEQLNILSTFIPQFEYLYGKFDAGFVINNTIHRPTFSGKLNISEGTLKIRDLIEPIYDITAAVNLHDKIISLEYARGKFELKKSQGESTLRKFWRSLFPARQQEGKILVTGDIDVHSLDNFGYNLSLEGTDIPIMHEVYDVSAIINAKATIQGNIIPTVMGDIEVIQAIYREPFASSEENAGLAGRQHETEEDLWNLDLNLTADNNIWVINPDMDAEFEGIVNISRDKGLYRLQGEIGTIRGRYYLPPLMDFRIDEGQIIFNDPEYVSISSIDPELNIEASTRISQSNEQGEVTGERIIYLGVSGKLSEPVLKLSSSEGASQQEILEYLTFHRSFSSAGSETSSPDKSLTNRARGLFGDLIGQQIKSQAARSIGVETLEIQPSAAGKLNLGQTRVTVGKYISPSVYLKYSRTLSHTSGQEIAAEYRLNRNFSLEAKSDASNLYHLDLNFNIEFK
ncbi:MAG: hypothetical protein CO189_04460 [candidate division Zixibacteria bacterium CG_4_9_14_3_um_filter_46_8]|nr:MAG: hypothetical protein CO189_04460 [candidate division Zixibacteria bacterium CG_4_9_14_3_um_filter_46_8]